MADNERRAVQITQPDPTPHPEQVQEAAQHPAASPKPPPVRQQGTYDPSSYYEKDEWNVGRSD